MACPFCGKNNFKWAKRCDHCKTPFTGEGLTHATPTPRESAVATPSTPLPVPSACGVDPADPAELQANVEILTTRVKSILASEEKPDWIFLCQLRNGGFLCLPPVNGQRSALLFTSPPLAIDYLRVVGEVGTVAGVKADSIAELCRSLQEAGTRSFCLNRCPRCQVALTFGLEQVTSFDVFRQIWATERASRFLQGQARAKLFFDTQKNGFAAMKLTLEALRDHGGADNAHVHQLLAIIANSQQDANSRAIALQRLQELQLPIKLETEDFARGFAEGLVGLMATFELLRVPGFRP